MTRLHTELPVPDGTGGDPGPQDIYLYECATDLVELSGPAWAQVLDRTALLLFTPDAVVSGQVEDGLCFLARHGYAVRAAAPVRLGRHHIREIWRRELAAPQEETRDRLAVCDRVLTYTDTVAVLLHDERPEPGVPASRRLNRLKGSGEPSQRAAGSLRAVLHSPNTVFRLVHASDGPLQVLRELGVLFEAPERRALLAAGGPPAISVSALAARAARAVPPPGPDPLDTTGPLRRVIAAVDQRITAGDTSPAATRLFRHLTDLSAGRPTRCHLMYDAVTEMALGVDPWDLIAVGAAALESLPSSFRQTS